ncbi:MAG: hypothetical protein JWR37_1039 [Mycobacterium sp.]|nr:hypothetical protein [Mycobacterium sp.]
MTAPTPSQWRRNGRKHLVFTGPSGDRSVITTRPAEGRVALKVRREPADKNDPVEIVKVELTVDQANELRRALTATTRHVLETTEG